MRRWARAVPRGATPRRTPAERVGSSRLARQSRSTRPSRTRAWKPSSMKRVSGMQSGSASSARDRDLPPQRRHRPPPPPSARRSPPRPPRSPPAPPRCAPPACGRRVMRSPSRSIDSPVRRARSAAEPPRALRGSRADLQREDEPVRRARGAAHTPVEEMAGLISRASQGVDGRAAVTPARAARPARPAGRRGSRECRRGGGSRRPVSAVHPQLVGKALSASPATAGRAARSRRSRTARGSRRSPYPCSLPRRASRSSTPRPCIPAPRCGTRRSRDHPTPITTTSVNPSAQVGGRREWMC